LDDVRRFDERIPRDIGVGGAALKVAGRACTIVGIRLGTT
jgi:hypothetical protein